MKETGMVPVFYHADLETAKVVPKACYVGRYVLCSIPPDVCCQK